METTQNWIVDKTNKTGWILIMSVNSRPSLVSPDSYFTCTLPSLNDPYKVTTLSQ